MITAKLLRAVGANPENAKIYAPLLEAARVVPGDDFATISSSRGVAMLVSQLSHESGHYSTLSENLNYSVAALSTGNRSRYFTAEQAQKLGYLRYPGGRGFRVADQKAIANLYYGSRLGNFGVLTDDGWNFRGAGLIQLTGRSNFTAFGKSIGMTAEEAADFARTPKGAVISALWFWRTNGLLVPASRGDVTRCTEIIQGADAGLASRIALYQAARTELG